MYREIVGGTSELIDDGQNQYLCHIPPPPPKHEILFYNLPPEEQYWRRTPIPESYIQRFHEEKAIRAQGKRLRDKKKAEYVDSILERYRRQEYMRRRWGVHMYINGKIVYITGHHYFYLMYGKADHKENNGYPYYYNFSRKAFYVRQYAEESPIDLGYIIIGGRGSGKSQEELACVMNNMTIAHNATAVLQSKNYEKDSKGVLFKTKLVLMFNALIDFMKPQFSHGSNPETGFVFNRDAKKGEAAKHIDYGPDFELNSFIFPVQPGNTVMDSDTAQEIFEDEVGKTDPAVADVSERHKVNLKVVWRNHRKVGILRKTSTVEKMVMGGAQCLSLWKDSDPKKRDANGQTVSKIIRYFISALDTDTSIVDVKLPDGRVIPHACDKFGNVDRKIANQKIENALEMIKHDYVAMSSEMRKSPRNVSEAFIQDQSKSIYNIQKLSNRLNQIRNEMPKVPYTKGNLYWLAKPFGPVGFKLDEHSGRFRFAWFPDEFKVSGEDPTKWKILNNFREEHAYDLRGKSRLMKFPGNDNLFRLSTDPIKYTRTKDPRASKAAMHGFRMYDPNVDHGVSKEKWQSHNFFAEYICRPDDPKTYLEDAAMLAIFMGAKFLPERNIPTLNDYFETNGLEKYLSYPRDFINAPEGTTAQEDSDDAGYASTPEMINHYTSTTIPFINDHIHRMPFDDTIEDWMNFDSLAPTKYDAAVSASFCLVHALKIAEKPESEKQSLNQWFDAVDNSGRVGKFADEDEYRISA